MGRDQSLPSSLFSKFYNKAMGDTNQHQSLSQSKFSLPYYTRLHTKKWSPFLGDSEWLDELIETIQIEDPEVWEDLNCFGFTGADDDLYYQFQDLFDAIDGSVTFDQCLIHFIGIIEWMLLRSTQTTHVHITGKKLMFDTETRMVIKALLVYCCGLQKYHRSKFDDPSINFKTFEELVNPSDILKIEIFHLLYVQKMLIPKDKQIQPYTKGMWILKERVLENIAIICWACHYYYNLIKDLKTVSNPQIGYHKTYHFTSSHRPRIRFHERHQTT